MNRLFLWAFCFVSFGVFAQTTSVPTPGMAQQKPIYILNATIHTATGEVIQNGTIGFENGKITTITTQKLQLSSEVEIINAEGKHVYPGFILPQTTLGLVEIGAVRATRDNYEVGAINPHVQSVIAYNTDSRIIPTVRCNGVLTAQIIPEGGRISGSSSVVQLDAWNYEDAIVKEKDGIQLNWPSAMNRSGWWAEPGETKVNDKYQESIEDLVSFFAEAKAYCLQKNSVENLRFAAMCGVFDQSKQVFVQANHVKEIEAIISFAKKQQIKVVICGGRDAWLLASELKAANIPVILTTAHDLPYRNDDDIDLPFKMAKILQDLGVVFAITAMNDNGDQRNLPFTAAKAVAYGLSPEQALQSITLNTAKILGIQQQLGSLELGKDATLFISKGDALDIMTNHVETAFIGGRKVDLDNKQKQLYRKYQDKYGNQIKQN